MSSSATNIIIIPFRINKGKMEVLLKSYVQKPKPFISLISGPTFAFDPSPIFSAARIFLTDFLAMSYQLDEKNINWDSHEFRKWLGIICQASEYHETDKSRSYFIESSSLLTEYHNKLNPSYLFSWYKISEIEANLEKFAPAVSIFIYYELGGIHEFFDGLKHEKKIYGILNTEPEETWENVYEACYQGYFQRPDEKWIAFKVGRGEFPSETQENQVKAWIITGSNSATYENKDWMINLFELIRRIVGRNGQQKLLGFCFGHQSIAIALGGSVERMRNLEYDVMLLYKNRIYLKEEFLKTSYVKNSLGFKRINITRGIYLNQAHGDFVKEIPKCATHFGFSDDIENEIMGVEDYVLSMQSHPEFSESMMIYRWLPEILKNDPELEDYRKKCIQSYYLGELHSKEMRIVCEDFLKSEIEQ